MNLIIDIGNSFVKVAVFKKDALVQKELIQSKDLLKTVKELKKKYKTLNKAIISSVGKVETTIIDVLKESFHVLVLNSQTQLRFKNLYGTPKTLGVDRMALVSASTKQFPKKNVLIVDAGTCITYDFINNKNEYFGGAISPGIRMRYQSLNNFTANLPLLETNLPTDIIGNSTATSIHSGIITGILKEIDGVISEYKEKYPDLTVILTGGDTKFLSKQLKSSIFANSNFLLEGLNHILQFNSN